MLTAALQRNKVIPTPSSTSVSDMSRTYADNA